MNSRRLEKRLEPRKVPSQPRAAESRTRILDAARRVISANGYASGTTNRIAAEAGMSVGSLYQYFPNKDSILMVLVQEHIDHGAEALSEAFGSVTNDEDLESLVRAVVGALADVHAVDRQLHRVLFEESPRPPGLLEQLRDLEDAAVALVAARIARSSPNVGDPVLPARLVVVTAESLVHRLVASDRPLDRDEFIDQATLLIAGYLHNLTGAESPGRGSLTSPTVRD